MLDRFRGAWGVGGGGRGDTSLSLCTMLPDVQVSSFVATARLPPWGKAAAVLVCQAAAHLSQQASLCE